jgi:hypothetical protein
MPPPPNYRKRRPSAHPNKNELKISRSESAQRSKASAGTLRERHPEVRRLHVEMRMESTAGAILDQANRNIGMDEPLLLDVTCQGGCGNGVFLLSDVIGTVLSSGQESREGMGLCQAASYKDPNLPCGTKFYYRVVVDR